MLGTEAKERKIKGLNRKKPALRTLNKYEMWNELSEMTETIDEVLYYCGEDDQTLLEALLGEAEIDAEELKTNCAILSAEIEQMMDDMNDRWSNPFPDHFDKIMTFSGWQNDNVLCWDQQEGDYVGVQWYSWDQEDLKESLKNLTKEQIIDEFRQSFQIAMAFLGLKARYDNLDCAIEVLRGGNADRCKTAKRLNELYESDAWKKQSEFDCILRNLPAEEWVK